MANTARGARTRTSAASNPQFPNARVISFPSSLSEPVVQGRLRGRLPRSIPRIPAILRERRFAECKASHLTDEQRRDDLEDALSRDYIRIVRRSDGTRSVSLAGRYMDDHEYAAEALWDVMEAMERWYGARLPQVSTARPLAPVLRLIAGD
ncbi:hypothetical protein NDR89_20040 [Cupriavidus gilardii]|uniref:Uncharacterized protein n=1 Tax=Cupriavidus gilardii TaxID=82541 RepID=A0ABY4VSG5_9BURK|nr:hypothetical protein [Cupriavidus gilardii]USE78929.1 hypothetical protein NDR89_20040 [Cupriavidus gilardii]